MDADADTGVVLAGCVGYEGELRLVVASGLGAAEVGVGVDAALEIGFVGDIEPAEPERAAADGAPAAAGAGPIFRGARPIGGALVDMTAAIISVFFLLPHNCLFFLFVPLLLVVFAPSSPCFFLLGTLAYQIDRRRWVECSCNNGRPGFIGATLPIRWATVSLGDCCARADSSRVGWGATMN